VGWQQDECRGWDVNEIVFSPAMWPVYHGLMRADFTLFDEYEHEHAGAQHAHSLSSSAQCKIGHCICFNAAQVMLHPSAYRRTSATAGDQPFDFPIVAYWGGSDRKITEAMVNGWQKFTTGSFELIRIDGHHLWPLIKDAKTQWLSGIVNRIDM